MKKLSLLAALLFSSAAVAQPAHNTVTLNWTNPTTYQSGQPLTVGQIRVFVDGALIQTSSAVATFTSDVLASGAHTFGVVVCDNAATMNCSSTATVSATIPPVVLVVPVVSNLTATVN